MRIRRWIAPILLLLCLCFAAVAEAVSLDEIGLRYTPAEGELYVTRDEMSDEALSALGTDRETLLQSMQTDHLYLISLTADGRQLSLGVDSAPSGIAAKSYAAMTAPERDEFLSALARLGDYATASWQSETDGYALFAQSPDSQNVGSLSYSAMSLSTLYLGRVYSLRIDVIGREAEQADADALIDASKRLLRLGKATEPAEAAAEAEALSLPAMEALPETQADVSYQNGGAVLELDPVSAIIGVTDLTLTGRTDAGGGLRYSVNGTSSSRVKANDDGTFTLNLHNLSGNEDNAVTVTAMSDAGSTTASFSVHVNWQTTPAALSLPDSVEGDTYVLSGLTLAGASVQLTKGRGSSTIGVASDGSFSVTLRLSRVGDNAFSLRILADGYRRLDQDFTITRVTSAAEALASLQKKVKTYDYAKVVAKPSAYAKKVVQLSGVASALACTGDQPIFTLTASDGSVYRVLCDDLLSVQEGGGLSLLGTLTGELTDDGAPVLVLGAIVL